MKARGNRSRKKQLQTEQRLKQVQTRSTSTRWKETYALSAKIAPSTAKTKKALEGTIRINSHNARVLFDTGTIGEDILSAAFVTTYGVETKALEGELRILMAMKGSQSTSSKQCVVDIEIEKMRTRNNRIIVGNLTKYDAMIRMEFLLRNQATI